MITCNRVEIWHRDKERTVIVWPYQFASKKEMEATRGRLERTYAGEAFFINYRERPDK